MYRRIIIQNVQKPREKDLSKDIEWFCNSFGLCSGRDVRATSAKILNDLLTKLALQQGIPSQQIANDLDMNCGMVNHHIRNLMESGLVYRQKKLIHLRGGSLRAAVEEMRKDSNRMFDEAARIADDIDSMLGLRSR